MRSPEAQKYIILTPDQLNDDSIIEKFENLPTSSRDRRVVEEIKKSHKKTATPGDPESLTDADSTPTPTDIPTGSTRIVF